MELSDIDLNQLVTFQQLMVERSVSRVADNLGLTQPAVSIVAAKLRRLLGDEHLRADTRRHGAHAFCRGAGRTRELCAEHDPRGLNQQAHFDPGSVKRALTIGMTDIGEIVFLPALLERLGIRRPA